MKFTVCQINPIPGNLQYNYEKIREFYVAAKDSDLVIFSELVTTCYSCEDLFLKPSFIDDVMSYIPKYAELTINGPDLLLGTPYRDSGILYNAAILFSNGNIHSITKKYDLPNYNVFDEKRIFTADHNISPVKWHGIELGILICEDTWTPYVSNELMTQGANILISLNGSPYISAKPKTRLEKVLKARVTETNLPIIFSCFVGGNDGIVFDGHSMVMNTDFTYEVMKGFEEDSQTFEFNGKEILNLTSPELLCEVDPLHEMYNALVLGLRDYTAKIGVKKVVLGKSGGADSAIVAAIAADALGPENVHCILMPSEYTSDLSNDLGAEFCHRSNISYNMIPINKLYTAWDETMKDVFGDKAVDVTEENAQARIRGSMILMAYSNKFGHLVLCTSNRSESFLNYGTIYGDILGGFNPIADVYKTDVYKLMEWRNVNIPTLSLNQKLNIIPEEIITRPASAELAPGQTDEKGLGGTYDILDGILGNLIDKDLGVVETIELGYDAELVQKVWNKIRGSEFKRKMSPLGTKIHNIGVGERDRRYPNVNQYKG